jgi:hypothetical protein
MHNTFSGGSAIKSSEFTENLPVMHHVIKPKIAEKGMVCRFTVLVGLAISLGIEKRKILLVVERKKQKKELLPTSRRTE